MLKSFKVFAVFVAIAAASPALAQQTQAWEIDVAHSEVSFRIRHLVSQVRGSFREFSGRVETNQANPAASRVSFTIQASSIDTGNADRDKHLRSADFFDVEKFPTITFVSSKIQPKGNNRFDVTGTLTMHGVAREITLPVEFTGTVKDPWGNTKAGFETATTLNRKDYGIVWNRALDSGGFVLGDDVQVSISLQVKAVAGQ
ncbi:MAG: YceI family protein [Acidobacteriota bacterium]|jgi:polyisoprenoid-binding protein YceI